MRRFPCPSELIPMAPRQAPDYLTKRRFSSGLDLFSGLVLNRVRDVDCVEVRPSERAGLRPGSRHEFVRCYRHCWNTKALDLC